MISVLANILPGEIRTLCDHIQACDMAEACRQHLRLFGLCRGMFVETNPIPIKAAMAMAGMIRNELRLPMTPLAEPHRAPLADLLREFGVEIQG